MVESRRSRKRDKTRQALVRSSLELFAEQGIYSPSIEEITSRADLGKGTFYQHFPSREALIAELVTAGFSQLLAQVESRTETVPLGEDRLPAVLDAHREFFSHHPEYLLLFHQARGWMKMARHHSEELRRAFDAYVRKLGALMGEASPEDAPLPARAVAAAGFIAGVLSFEKILGLSSSPDLFEALAHLAPPKAPGVDHTRRKGEEP